MASPPSNQFGKRGPVLTPSPPVKRSHHVALLLTGALAVGGTAYALVPYQSCQPATVAAPSPLAPGMATPPPQAAATNCGPRSSGGHGGSGSGGSWSNRSSFFGGSSGSSSGGSNSSGGGETSRGGFGGFGHAIGAHASGG